jgi:hypothetical protein
LEHLSDYEFQKVAWTYESNIYSSYSDEVEAVFDEGLEDALYSGHIVFGKAADKALRRLNKKIEAVGYERNDEELIDSQEMVIIRERAAKALELVLKSDGSESTVEIVE